MEFTFRIEFKEDTQSIHYEREKIDGKRVNNHPENTHGWVTIARDTEDFFGGVFGHWFQNQKDIGRKFTANQLRREFENYKAFLRLLSDRGMINEGYLARLMKFLASEATEEDYSALEKLRKQIKENQSN